MGYFAEASKINSTAVGSNTMATEEYSLAIGTGVDDRNSTKTTASKVGSIAIGGNATKGARATGVNAIAIG